MSVNYSLLHAVDMPVTDLDDGDVDFIGNNQPSEHQREPFDPLDDLDYEAAQINNDYNFYNNPQPGRIVRFFQSVRNSVWTPLPASHPTENSETGVEWWASKIRTAGRSLRTNNYELQDFSFSSEEGISATKDMYSDSSKKSTFNRFFWPGLSFILLVACTALIVTNNPFHSKSASSYSNIDKIFISNSTHQFHPTTIMISLDGFHPHYINAKLTPTLHDMLVRDFGAPYMTPSFPSLTFPNHWTMVTGLYPSEHGIVGNTFYDPKLKKPFVNTNPKFGALDPEFWSGGEPIWQTAASQGVNSAIHMWPGSEVPSVGVGNGPKYVDQFNGLELLSSKIDRVLAWLDIEDINERPELILTYVPTIDTIGHALGIGGEELKKGLTYVDNFVNLLLLELTKRNLDEIVNVIIVSDHGMAPTSNDRLLYIDDLINIAEIEHIDGWPLFGLRPKEEDRIEDIYNSLIGNLNKAENSDHYHVYKVEELPKEWHFGGEIHHKFDYRLAPLWVVPDVGYSITTHKQMEDYGGDYKPHGVHGYNNTELLMRALFLGRGPYFKNLLGESGQTKINPFANTEVYNLICDTLNLRPAPNNGTFETSSMAATWATPRRLISALNLLKDWTDNLTFPNLPFEIDHVVNDATYDILFKPNVDRISATTVSVSTNTNPSTALKSAASTLASLSEFTSQPLTTKPTTTTSTEPPSKTSVPHSGESTKIPSEEPHWWEIVSGVTEGIMNDVESMVDELYHGIFGEGQ